jgi:hydrogen peroxide-dependent heme synthase
MADGETYAFYPVFRAAKGLRTLDASEREAAFHEADLLFKEWSDTVTLRASYSTVGFRPDADMLMWWVARSAGDIQDLLVAFRRTAVGRNLDMTWSFLGVVRPAEFSRDHVPAFVRGEPPKGYVCVYPYVRTEEWYLLPAEERAALLREHGEMGREFPDVLANTTSNFGMGDWEWILAFEADELHRIVDCIRRLRDSASRRYTKVEVPFVSGIRKDLAEALGDLV